MNFKSRKELKLDGRKEASVTFNTGIDIAFNSFAKRINFYNFYKDDWHLLQIKHYKIYGAFYDFVLSESEEGLIVARDLDDLYLGWLFDYCFKDLAE